MCRYSFSITELTMLKVVYSEDAKTAMQVLNEYAYQFRSRWAIFQSELCLWERNFNQWSVALHARVDEHEVHYQFARWFACLQKKRLRISRAATSKASLRAIANVSNFKTHWAISTDRCFLTDTYFLTTPILHLVPSYLVFLQRTYKYEQSCLISTRHRYETGIWKTYLELCVCTGCTKRTKCSPLLNPPKKTDSQNFFCTHG